jgi:hypothetical protein
MSIDSPSQEFHSREVLVRKATPLAMGKRVSAYFNLTACVAPVQSVGRRQYHRYGQKRG